jgi:hypothetical protein
LVPSKSGVNSPFWLDPSTSRTLQTTEQIQNQKDYENGYDYAVRSTGLHGANSVLGSMDHEETGSSKLKT